MDDEKSLNTLREAWQQVEPWGLIPWGVVALVLIAWNVALWISSGDKIDRVGVVGIFVGLLAVSIGVATLVFVLRQVRLAEQQNVLVAKELDIALSQTALMDRQTTILEYQDVEIRKAPKVAMKMSVITYGSAEPGKEQFLLKFVVRNTGDVTVRKALVRILVATYGAAGSSQRPIARDWRAGMVVRR